MTSCISVTGGRELVGTVRVGGAKNAVLPILAASIMAKGRVILHNVPAISDVDVMCDILRRLGATVTRGSKTAVVDCPDRIDPEVPPLASKIRFSIVLLGAVLAKAGEVHLPLPGGDSLGDRRIDQHILALQRLGADVTVGKTHIHARSSRLVPCSHTMTFPSVSGTETSVMLACAATGRSEICGVALEPEVQSFMRFLCALGANIAGIGKETITVRGTSHWGGAEVEIIPDRLEAATYAMFVAATGGTIFLEGLEPGMLDDEWRMLRRGGLKIEQHANGVHVFRERGTPLRPLKTCTGRYPLFYTDLQPILVSLLCLANGDSQVTETLYGANRFQYVPELQKMGAKICTSDNVALITGIDRFLGAEVKATDIRAGASLVLAALSTPDRTLIRGLHHIDRGYQHLEENLARLGADVQVERIRD